MYLIIYFESLWFKNFLKEAKWDNILSEDDKPRLDILNIKGLIKLL